MDSKAAKSDEALAYLTRKIVTRRQHYADRYIQLSQLHDDFHQLLVEMGQDVLTHVENPESAWERVKERCLQNRSLLQDEEVRIYVLGDSPAACDELIQRLIGCADIPAQVWANLQETVTFRHGHGDVQVWLKEGEVAAMSLSALQSYTERDICALDVKLPAKFLQSGVCMVVRPKLRRAPITSELLSKNVLIMVRSMTGGNMSWQTRSLTKRDLALIEHRTDNVLRLFVEPEPLGGSYHGDVDDVDGDILPVLFLPHGCSGDSQEWQLFLSHLDTAVTFILKNKIIDTFSWLQKTSHNLQKTLHVVMEQATEDQKLLEKKWRDMTVKLERKQREAGDMLIKLEEQISRAKEQLSSQCLEHLHSPEMKKELKHWENQELPKRGLLESWEGFKDKLHHMIAFRIQAMLSEFVSETGIIQRAMLDIQQTLLDELIDIDQQYSGAENILGNPTLASPGSPKRLFLARKTDVFPVEGLAVMPQTLGKLANFVEDMVVPTFLPMLQTALWGPDEPIRIDFSKISEPMSNLYSSIKGIAEYSTNPVIFMDNLSFCTLEQIGENEVSMFLEKQFQPAAAILDCGRDVIYNVLTQQQDFLVKGQGQRTHTWLEKARLLNESQLQQFINKLSLFAEGALSLEDFTIQKVQTLPISQGMYADYHRCTVEYDGKTGPVLAKIYRTSATAKCWRDEMTFSKVNHPHIAEVLGCTKLTVTPPANKTALLYRGLLRPAREDYFGSSRIPEGTDGRNILIRSFKQFLEQVALGLEYLHTRGLVHLDLSLDTVMVCSNTKQVKLVNVGEAAPVDVNTALQGTLGSHIYIAPEVLRGEYYSSHADVYSLGLMAWELWEQKLAFESHRGDTLLRFREVMHVSALGSTTEGPFTPLVLSSLHEAPQSRITASDWVDSVRQIVLPEDHEEEREAKEN